MVYQDAIKTMPGNSSSGSISPCLHKTQNILSHQVKFKVYRRTGSDMFEIRMFKGVRYDGNRELVAAHVKNGKTDPVQANGTFFNNERSKLGGKAEAAYKTAVFPVYGYTGTGCVNMALYDMTIEPAIERHASFQVNDLPLFPLAQGGFGQCFRNGGHAVAIG